MNNHRKTILGVPVDTYQPDEFLKRIEKDLQGVRIKSVIAVNAEKIMHARKDPELLSILKESDFLIPDGFGPIVGLKLEYGIKILRTSGVMLMKMLLDLAEKKDIKIFIFGSKHEAIEEASKNIRKKHPALRIVGTQHGYIPSEEYRALIERINRSGADILFVGLGSPKQEKWIHKYKNQLNVKFCMGIGGSLDVIADKVPLAPAWISRIYLEWIYRLVREPKRLHRQKVIPVFILSMLKESIFIRMGNKIRRFIYFSK